MTNTPSRALFGWAAALAAVVSMTGCSSIGSATLPHPRATNAVGLVVSPVNVSMGPGDVATLSASESGYSGTFSSTDDCAGIATVGSLGASQFKVTGVAPGLCTITVADSKGNSQQIAVSIQTTVVGGQ